MNKFYTISRVSFILLIFSKLAFAQQSLDYFIGKAKEHSPALNEYRNLLVINQVQNRLNRAQNSAYQVSLTGDYLFTPYFNNHGDLITSDPSPEAIGYEIALYDGGLYSLQLNVERNLFNGKLLNALDRQARIQSENYEYASVLEHHNLEKEVTEQYLNTLRTARLIRLSREIVINLEQQLTLTAEMMERGYIKAQDYLLLQIEVKNQTINLWDARQQYKSDILKLYELCGIQDTAIVDINPITLEQGSPKTASNFTQKYVLDSLATIAEQKVLDTKYQPQLKVYLNAGVNAIQLQNIQRKFGMSAGVNLLLPLFDGRQKKLTRQQNLLARQIISEYRRSSERNIALQREDLQSQIESLQKNIESLTKQIQDYNKLLEISANQLQQGNMSMIDYLTLLRNFTDLRISKIEVEINYQLEINKYNYWNW